MCLNDYYNESEDKKKKKKVSSYSFARPKQKQVIKVKTVLNKRHPENVLFVCLFSFGVAERRRNTWENLPFFLLLLAVDRSVIKGSY